MFKRIWQKLLFIPLILLVASGLEVDSDKTPTYTYEPFHGFYRDGKSLAEYNKPATTHKSSVATPVKSSSNTQEQVKIYIVVSGDDKAAIRTVESHLKRELRLLGDVDIVPNITDDWQFCIQFAILSEEVLDVKRYSIATYQGFRVSKEVFKELLYYKAPSTLMQLSVLGVARCGKEKLRQYCIEYISDFDKEILSIWRQ